MHRLFLIVSVCALGMLTTLSSWAADEASANPTGSGHSDTKPENPKGPPPAIDDHWGMLNYYCTKCHNATDWAGGVAFDTMSQDSIVEDAETWEHAIRKLRGQLMPPPGNPQPAKAARKEFISYMENTLDKAAEGHPSPGRVALHRLNRKEYANAVHDLLDVDVDVNTLLPEDNVSDGFDNVANVLQVTPSFLDQYVAAARSVAVQAIGDGSVKPMGVQYFAPKSESQHFYEEGLPLGTRGGIAVDHTFPADGEYELNIANMAVALWVFNMEFKHHLIATLDGRKFWETDIGGEEDMKAIDQKQDPAVDAINARLKGIRFHAPAGPHKVAVAFVQRTFAESDDKLYQQVPGGGQDRVLKVASFEVKGPFKVTGMSDTPSRKRVFACYPKTPAEEGPCAEQIVQTLATRAFRRPITGAEKATLMKFYQQGHDARDGGNFDVGIRRVMTAILASPSFLYRAEPAPETAQPGSIYRINDLELASRLSFFLWSTVPDDELRKIAVSGKLREPEVLKAQVKRMLADPRSQTLATSFAFQWLNVGKLAEIDPDMNIFPYAADPRDDFRTELKLFIDSVFREDHNVMDLLGANYTYLNERLALHYGIKDVRGDQWRRVELKDTKRYGLLGKGAVLMLTSYPNRTAPVLRGAWILERINGTPPHSPPPNVEALKDAKPGQKPKTLKEQMALHRTKQSCFSCHGVMDPLGFALENFDATGKWREKDRLAETAIDSSGELPDGSVVNGPDDLRNALLANPDQFVQTLTEKLMTYALGRTVDYQDMPTVRAIVRAAAKDDYRFSSIVMNIVTSAPFEMRQVPTEKAPAQTTAAITVQRQEVK
jgi:mono/diheme cytochrome c family protein